MKVFSPLIFALVLIGVFVHGRVIEEASEEKEHKLIERFLKKRCSKNGDQEDLDRALEKFDATKHAIKSLLPKHTEDDEEKLEERCMENRKAAVDCFDEFIDAIKPCVDPKENYIIDFLKEAIAAYTEYFCEHSKILTLTELLETNTAKCINRLTRNKEINPQVVCYRSAKIAKHEEDSPITKTELCRDLDVVYECYERTFKEHCEDAPKAWEFESGLLNATKSPCSN